MNVNTLSSPARAARRPGLDRRAWRAVVGIGLLVTVTSCTSDDGGARVAKLGDATTTTEKRHELVATFASNGGTLSVIKGDRIRVVLVGTAWKFGDPSSGDTLEQSGDIAVLPAADDCATGGDCGSTTAYFDVTGVGESDIVAGRSECPASEPGCATGDEAFTMKVVAPEG